jgi:hypothetical protein
LRGICHAYFRGRLGYTKVDLTATGVALRKVHFGKAIEKMGLVFLV